MGRLVDGDLAANNGGWQWSASSGMDPKPLRIFNPATQAARFDPEAAYIRRWLPELAHVATADLISGEIAPLERRGYPEPIVSHRQQQARFKALYAALPRARRGDCHAASRDDQPPRGWPRRGRWLRRRRPRPPPAAAAQ